MSPRRLEDYDQSYFARLTLWGLVWRAIAVVVVVAAILAGIGFFFGWFNAAKQVVSPNNVRAQWQFAYTYNEALKGIAQNICTAEAAVKAETDPTAQTDRRSQLIAQENLYQLRERDYDAALENAFKAKYVRPHDVPTKAPTLAQEKAAVCTEGTP